MGNALDNGGKFKNYTFNSVELRFYRLLILIGLIQFCLHITWNNQINRFKWNLESNFLFSTIQLNFVKRQGITCQFDIHFQCNVYNTTMFCASNVHSKTLYTRRIKKRFLGQLLLPLTHLRETIDNFFKIIFVTFYCYIYIPMERGSCL